DGRHPKAQEFFSGYLTSVAPELLIKSAREPERVNQRETSHVQSDQLSAMDQLNTMIGLDSVKMHIRRLANFVTVEKQRAAQSNKPFQGPTMHMVFTGNPGTGKTEVANLTARLLHEIGFQRSDKCVLADRSTLVGEYIGHTEQKTLEKCKEALDGVLFIDEAYSLAESDDGRDFGRIVITTLLKFMEDNRERLVVIAAGYKDEMKKFIRSNPG